MGKIHDALLKTQKAQFRQMKAGTPNKNAQSNLVPGQKSIATDNIVPIQPVLNNAAVQLDEKLVVYHQPKSIEAELFRLIRSNILFPKEKAAPRTILVTSVSPGDGKSLIASNLAISMSQGLEDHVLLIDGDLRHSTINNLFGLSNRKGLGDHLVDDMPIENLLVKTPIEKLSILPAGLLKQNPTEILSSKKMHKLLNEVKNRYNDRYIIIDSAPPKLAAETNALARIVDGIIIVVKHRHTQRRLIAELVESFGKERIFGVVMNYVSSTSLKYYGISDTYALKKST